ncbi:MAG: hypothetical protein V4584_00780 [Verrucomicrobiota bacterium]
MMKMKHKKFWFFCGLAAMLVGIAFYKMQAYYVAREFQLELANTRLHERLFIEMMRVEIDKTLPNKAHSINASGGVTESYGNFDFTTMNDVFFEETIPAASLESLANNLSGNLEISNWLSLASQNQRSRFCQFQVVEQSGKSYIRMLMHESNHPDGVADDDLRNLFSGDYYQKQAAVK